MSRSIELHTPQKCRARKLRNVLSKLPRGVQADLEKLNALRAEVALLKGAA